MNNTLVKGLQVLEALAASRGARGVSELAESLGMAKSAVHRLLQALLELGYVQQDDSRAGYRVSLKVWELGIRALASFDLRHAAEPAMYRLLEQTRETVHLSVLDGEQVVYVHKLDSPEPVRSYSEIGGRAPAACVATGKAMLAFAPAPFLDSLARRLVQHSINSIVEPDLFLKEMERTRTLGYAVNRGEWRDSVHGVAAPIRGANGAVVGAIGISGPAHRLRPAAFKASGQLLVQAAQAIGGALGA